jgi:hypothetical protein
MTPPVWMIYVGVVTGILGLALGVLAYINSIIAIRRTAKSKRLDLRVELRKQTQYNERAIGAVFPLIYSAWGSHIAVAHALGTSGSGGFEVDRRRADEDRKAILRLKAATFDHDDLYALSEKELLDLLIAAHHASSEIKAIRDRYEAWRVEDEKNREFIRNAAIQRASGR